MAEAGRGRAGGSRTRRGGRARIGHRRDRGRPRRALSALLAAALLLLVPAAAPAQEDDEEEPGWHYAGELTVVFTGGNAESSTFGLGTTLRHLADRTELTVEGGAIRTESAIVDRRAIQTPDGFRIVEESDTRLTAEKYRGNARLDYELSQGAFLYGGLSFLRNTFAGVDNRFTFVTGAGRTWAQGEDFRFKTGLAATYTFQEDVLDVAAASDRFAGARFNANLFRKLTETTSLTSELVLDENLDETEDLRADLTNALQVAINEALALQTSVQLVYDNLPSFTSVPLETEAGEPTGETVPVRLEELDSFFTVALVVTF